jgi:hypothetical protein
MYVKWRTTQIHFLIVENLKRKNGRVAIFENSRYVSMQANKHNSKFLTSPSSLMTLGTHVQLNGKTWTQVA